MLTNIMTAELMDAIEQLQESFKNSDMTEMMESLENYEFNIEKFEEQIDRFMDMFELALAEQKLNELAEHLENMINKQTQLIDNIIDEKDNYVLNKQSVKQENRFSDLVDAIVRSMSLKRKFEIINIGSGKSYSIKKIILTLQKICEIYYPIKNRGLKRPNEILSTRLNINKAKKILKWKPLYSLENGLRSVIYNKTMFNK